MTQRLFGHELRVGDTIKTWFSEGRDTIIGLKPYRGSLSHLWNDRAQIASFAINKVGMTIDPDGLFTVIARQGPSGQ